MSDTGVALLARRFLTGRRHGGRGRLVGAVVGVALSMVPLVVVQQVADGMIAGIEVKASATVKSGDFAGLRALAEACGDRFAFGTVLYDSTDVVPFGDRLAAAPLSCLWS